MNLEQLPYQPGDIVRDRKTKVDYAIESIAGFTLAGGLTIVGVGLLNDKLDKWKAFSETEMLDNHDIIRQGNGKVPGVAIRAAYRNRIEELLNRDKDIISELFKEENEGLKDLLLYGVTSEIDDPTKAMNVALINLAESLTTLTGKRVSKESIKRLLKDKGPSSMPDSALDIIASNIEIYSRAKSKSGNLLTSTDLKTIMFNSGGKLGGDLFTLHMGGNVILGDKENATLSKALYGVISGKNTSVNQLLGLTGGTETGSGDRIRLLAERMFLIKSQDSALNPLTQSFLNKEGLLETAAKIVRNEVGDKGAKAVKDSNPNKKGAQLLLNAIANFLLDPANKDVRRQIMSSVTSYEQNLYTGSKASRLSRITGTRHASFAEAAKRNFGMASYTDQYNRFSAIKTRKKPLNAFRLMSIQEIEKAIQGVQVDNFAISKDAFFTSVLGSTRIKIGSVEGTLRDKGIRDQLAKIDDAADPYFVIGAKQFHDLRKHVAAGEAASGPYDLTSFINEQGALKERILPKHKEELVNSIIDLSGGDGDQAIVALNTKDQMELLFRYAKEDKTTGNNYEVVTADLAHMKQVLRDNDYVPGTTNLVSIHAPESSHGRYIIDTIKSIDKQAPGGFNTHTMASTMYETKLDSVKMSKIIGTVDRISSRVGSVSNASLISDIVENKANSDRLALFTKYKPSGSEQELFKTSFKKGYEAGKLAIGRVKGKTGFGGINFIGSEVNQPIEVQLQRAKEYFDGKGILLDIEAKVNEQTGQMRVSEVAFGGRFGDKNRIMFNFNANGPIKSPEEQAKNMIELSNQLAAALNDKNKPITSVGTAGATDFNRLIEYSQDLLQSIDGVSSMTAQDKAEIKAQLVKSIETFEGIQKNNLFDVQTLYPLSGEKGIVRQSYFTQKFLGTFQRHRAKLDVRQLSEILEKLSPKILEGMDQVEFGAEEDILKKGVFIMDNDTLSPSSPRKIRRILGTMEYLDSYTNESRTGLKYGLYEVKEENGVFKLVDTNRVGVDTYDSAQQLALSLERNHYIFTDENQLNEFVPSTGQQKVKLGQKYLDANKEAASRRIRSYNPLAKSRFDPTGKFEDYMGSFAALNLEADSQLVSLMPEIEKKYSVILDEVRGASQLRELTALEKILAMEKLDQYIDATLTNIYPKEEETANYIGKDFLKIKIKDALDGNGMLAAQVSGPESDLSKLINSPAGQSLLDSAKIAIGLGTTDNFSRGADPLEFTLKSIYYNAAAAEKASKQISTATKLSDFLQESNARMSLKIGAEAVSFDVANSASLETQELLRRMYDVSAEVMFNNNKNEETLLPVLKNLNIGFEEFQSLTEKFNSMHEGGLEGYKKALRTLAYTEDTQFRKLVQVQNKLISSNIKETFTNALNEKITNLAELESQEVDPESKANFVAQREYAQEIFTKLEGVETEYVSSGAKRKIKKKSNEAILMDISNILTESSKENPETFNSLMRDRFLKPANIGDLSDVEVKSINTSLFDALDGVQQTLLQITQQDTDGVTMDHIIYDVAHNTSTINGTYERAIGARSRISEIIQLHKQGNSLQSILTPSSVKEAHKVVVKAKKAADQQKTATGGINNAAATLGTEGPQGSVSSASKTFSKVSVPLLALGGIVGLLAAKQPNLGDTFSQGNVSKSLGTSFTGNENVIAKFSEIPGSPESQQIWYGGTMPFQIDMTFNGFVGNRMEHEKLQREVYNILSSNMEVRKTSGEIQDNRNKQHRMAAVEALRGHM